MAVNSKLLSYYLNKKIAFTVYQWFYLYLLNKIFPLKNLQFLLKKLPNSLLIIDEKN